MPLSLASVKDALIAKNGYTISPKARMLRDLKDLTDNLRAQRELAGVTCNGHTAFAPAGMSLGNFNDIVSKVIPLKCSCQNQTSACNALGYTCTCHNRASCSCNTQSCSCNQVYTQVCTCDYNSRTCSCNGEYVCYCDYNSWCWCEGDHYCSCNSESGGCESEYSGSYTSTYSCGCYSESGCTALGYSCTCNSRAASCPCNALYSN